MSINPQGQAHNFLTSPARRFAALCFLTGCFAAATTHTGVLAAEPNSETTAERLVSSALTAEAKGDLAGRTTALRGAVQMAPDNKLARWHLGQMEIDGKWLAVDDAHLAAAADRKLKEYQARRKELGDSLEGQIALARWCEDHRLEQEARFHWSNVLAIDPNQAEAQRALGVRWFNGRLMSPEQITAAKAAEAALRSGKTRLAGWQRQLEGDLDSRMKAIREIRALDDPGIIPALESVTLRETTSDLAAVQSRLLTLALFDALDGMSNRAAGESLVRHAVLSPLPSVQREATKRLKTRSVYDYIPALLDGLAMPVSSWFGVITDTDGSVHYRHALYREGPFADWSLEANRSAWRQPSAGEMTIRGMSGQNLPTEVLARFDGTLRRGITRNVRNFTNQFGSQAYDTERAVGQFNGSVEKMNEMIVPVLTETTGKDLGASPRAWWNWWQDELGYESSQDRPVLAYSYQDDTRYSVPLPIASSGGGSVECFVRGTPVWTKTGLRPIESLQMGDLVLSQNVNTGELAYKPIVGTTRRPPTQLVTLTVGEEKITSTLGHPFWVAGKGWQLARKLEDGMVLHGVKEPVRLAATQPAEEAITYNLIVADFASYFVGKTGILVHDNTMERSSLTTVPGLAAK